MDEMETKRWTTKRKAAPIMEQVYRGVQLCADTGALPIAST
ncbi:hypothetical protein GL267_008300 [Acidithiobacillus ferrianus]|uniref:Uncharacterized protein n=1 Tax=Acidithiobacillus ferrianus TaxID=2678518 RepID=A0ACD5H347_9PROT|nr:hypothetical protein [Acidithiobacillus ferrianus]